MGINADHDDVRERLMCIHMSCCGATLGHDFPKNKIHQQTNKKAKDPLNMGKPPPSLKVQTRASSSLLPPLLLWCPRFFLLLLLLLYFCTVRRRRSSRKSYRESPAPLLSHPFPIFFCTFLVGPARRLPLPLSPTFLRQQRRSSDDNPFLSLFLSPLSTPPSFCRCAEE